MTLFRMFATLAFSASVLSACGPQDPGSDVSRQGLRVGGYTDPNSNQAFGGVIAGETVTGLFYAGPQAGKGPTSPTGWWVSTAASNQYAPVLSMTYNSQAVTSLSSTQGVLRVQPAAGLPQLLQGATINFQMAVGEPLNATVRITSAQSTATYTKYVTEWAPENTSTWFSFCPHPYDGSDGRTNLPEFMIPVGGANWSANGTRNDNSNAIQLSCTHDSIGGCIRWGYEPWGFVTNPDGTVSSQSLKLTHQACTRMKRGDICGNGDPTTTQNQSAYDHTTIQLWDRHDIHTEGAQTGATMEAHWGVSGAICFNESEFRSTSPSYVQRAHDQLQICPKPACIKPVTVDGGAAAFVSSSRICQLFDAQGNCVGN